MILLVCKYNHMAPVTSHFHAVHAYYGTSGKESNMVSAMNLVAEMRLKSEKSTVNTPDHVLFLLEL